MYRDYRKENKSYRNTVKQRKVLTNWTKRF